MRVLVLSFYYPPDLAAGSFRASAFVAALQRKLNASDRIDVFTSAPNRYHSFHKIAPATENIENVSITRVPVPRHRSGMAGQAAAFASFAWGVRHRVKGDYDVIWATSSRLFTAFLGALLSRRLNAPLYLDMRDIFTEVIEEVIAKPVMKPLWVILRQAERYTISRSSRIAVVSQAFEKHFRNFGGDTPIAVFPNGIDEEFLEMDYAITRPSEKLTILYAGNIGKGQGLHRIIPPCAKRLGGSAEFVVIGDGGARAKLESALSADRISNVRLLAPADRARLMELYARSNYLFLHLNDYKAFRKVLPSKIFEYAATGKPIIAGVEGYARKFIEENIENSAVFSPCDVDGFVTAMRSLKTELVPRKNFIRKFRRTVLMDSMVSEVLQCV